jgi:hypothetical protein
VVGEEPAFYFTHFWGKGTVRELASAVQNALVAQKGAGAKERH